MRSGSGDDLNQGLDPSRTCQCRTANPCSHPASRAPARRRLLREREKKLPPFRLAWSRASNHGFIRFAAVNGPNLDSSPRCRKRKFAPPTDHLSQTPCQQGHDHITTARSCTTRAKRSEIPPWSIENPPNGEDCQTSRDRKRNDIFRPLREKALASIAFRREKQLDSSSNSRERISNRNPKIALPSIQVFREQPFTTGTLRSRHNHAVPKM